MNEDWEVDSMMEFDHYQNIARAAFGDMLYDSDRVNIFEINCLYLTNMCDIFVMKLLISCINQLFYFAS